MMNAEQTQILNAPFFLEGISLYTMQKNQLRAWRLHCLQGHYIIATLTKKYFLAV